MGSDLLEEEGPVEEARIGDIFHGVPTELQQLLRKGNDVRRYHSHTQSARQSVEVFIDLMIEQTRTLCLSKIGHSFIDLLDDLCNLIEFLVALALESVDDVLTR